MAESNYIKNYIDEALMHKGDVKIKYRDYKGEITERIVTPLEWITHDKFLGYCHLRQAERHFRIQNILIIGNNDVPPEDKSVDTIPPHFASENNKADLTLTYVPEKYPIKPSNQRTFHTIKTSGDWHSLLAYFIECLNYEYQQQFSFYAKALFDLDLDPDLVYKFFSGQYTLNFTGQKISDEFREFVDPRRKRNQQLCLGKSFILFNDGKICPLLFVPVTIKGDVRSDFKIQAEEVSLSYAALSRLQYTPEEIAEFLSAYENFVSDQPPLSEIENFIFNSLKENFPDPSLETFDTNFISLEPNYKMRNHPGLFWVNNRFTGNLIDDLTWLQNESMWSINPENIDKLFNDYPEHNHRPAPDFLADKNFYVTDINSQQRKAVFSVSDHPVTIVTGPPGTGKSQLVLNLITQAFSEGQSVLFASHNNQAVNVVMDRLQNEINFQGAIRTGNRQYRRNAVVQMENALKDMQPVDINHLEQLYNQGKSELKHTDSILKNLRDIKGKIQSYQKEKADILERVPKVWRAKLSLLNTGYNESEKTKINEFLSETLAKLREIIHQGEKLKADLKVNFLNSGAQDKAFHFITDYEIKWGALPIGFIQEEIFDDLSGLLAYGLNWKNLFSSLKVKKELLEITKKRGEITDQIDQNDALMTDDQITIALKLAELDQTNFKNKQEELHKLSDEYRIIKEEAYAPILKILIKLHILNPIQKFVQHLTSEMKETGLNTASIDFHNLSLTMIEEEFTEYYRVVQTAVLFKSLQEYKEQICTLQKELADLLSELPPGVPEAFNRMDFERFLPTQALDFLELFTDKVSHVLEDFNKVCHSLHLFFVENEERFVSIKEFQIFDKNDEPVGLFELPEKLNEEHIFAWVSTLRRALVVWESNSIINHSHYQLTNLPTEPEALNLYNQASQSLFKLAGNLMRAHWCERASKVSNEVWEGTRKYISAVHQLNELNYSENPELYRDLKQAERDNFQYAFQMFPIWAITNLTARTNFPQSSGLFDLVIIDEASQCDIPSAVPLLFRAKRAVIIGDPNQLRHVASLQDELDKKLGEKYGVGLEAFSYRSVSLYDLGERSVGNKPGPILLNEHYRSDPRIINFSNKTFYQSRLDIKTDLTQQGFDKDYLNEKGGIHWLDVKGNFERPFDGSGRNLSEFNKIKEVLPMLLKSLDQAGYSQASVGIVTPFRAQENLINSWLRHSYPNNPRQKSGTAHQFQGDECDVMIFSPVLSDDIPQGTLNWLERTGNLLNVAITRARVSLLIVGDFNFCYSNCENRSKYHQLAAYVKDELGGVFSMINELPLFGGGKFEVLGTILDPSNPEFNRTNLIRFISSCRDYVDWVDPYFTQEIIHLFDDMYEQEPFPNIKSFRLLTAERQVKVSSGKLRPESVESLQSYLEGLGVAFDMRVLPGEELPHDRFLYHQGGAINMPPFSGAYGSHHHVSEYTLSNTNRELFEEYWEKAISVIDVY